MEKINFSNINKKCMHCGKNYSTKSLRKNCSCKDHGRLFAVGEYYNKKTSRG
jgi:hypothetical protein